MIKENNTLSTTCKDWQNLLKSLADGYKDHPSELEMRANAAIIAVYITELEKIIEEEIKNQQQNKKGIETEKIVLKLYTIRNIANIAFQYPDSYAEVYVLQDILNHISEMTQDLIENVDG